MSTGKYRGEKLKRLCRSVPRPSWISEAYGFHMKFRLNLVREVESGRERGKSEGKGKEEEKGVTEWERRKRKEKG